jgi:hypothetical protein
VSQNDEKECGGWLDEEEKRKVLKKVQVECRVEKVWWRGESEGGKGPSRMGPSATGGGARERTWKERGTLRVELKVAGDVVEQAPGTASGQRNALKRLKAEGRRSTCNSSRAALRLTLFGWVAL